MLLKLRNATNVRWWSSSFVVAATDTSIKSRCPMPPHPEQPLDAFQDRYTSGDSTRSDLYALPQESRARSRSPLREPPRVRARDVYGCGQGVAEGVSSSFSIGHVACIKIMWKKWSATRSSVSKTDQNSNTRTSLRSRRMSSRSSNWILTTIQHFLTRVSLRQVSIKKMMGLNKLWRNIWEKCETGEVGCLDVWESGWAAVWKCWLGWKLFFQRIKEILGTLKTSRCLFTQRIRNQWKCCSEENSTKPVQSSQELHGGFTNKWLNSRVIGILQ